MVPGEGLSPVEIARHFQAVRGWWARRDLERWDTFQGFLKYAFCAPGLCRPCFVKHEVIALLYLPRRNLDKQKELDCGKDS